MFEQSPDAGLELDLLQEFCFVPLDIFQQIYHNKGIRDRRDAWLVFLSMEEPEAILDLLECCPDLGAYEEIDQQKEEISQQKEKLDQKDRGTGRAEKADPGTGAGHELKASKKKKPGRFARKRQNCPGFFFWKESVFDKTFLK